MCRLIMPKANTNWGICEAGIHFPHEPTTVEPGKKFGISQVIRNKNVQAS